MINHCYGVLYQLVKVDETNMLLNDDQNMSKVFKSANPIELLRSSTTWHCATRAIDKAWILELETRRKMKQDGVKLDSAGNVYVREERTVRTPLLKYKDGKYHHICAICGKTKEEHAFKGGWFMVSGKWEFSSSNKLDHAFKMWCLDTNLVELGIYTANDRHPSDTASPHEMSLRGASAITSRQRTRSTGMPALLR